MPRRRALLELDSTWDIALLLGALAVWLAWAFSFWFVTDDAFISFRYARNWADGLGVVYNAGERVEGYSNFLWVVAATLVEAFEGAPATWMPALSMACGVGLALTCWHSARRRLGFDRATALVTTLALLFAPGCVVWATSGLETMPAAWLLFLVFDRWVLASEEREIRGAMLPALGLALIRAEGIAWVALIAALGAARRALDHDFGGARAVGRSLALFAPAFAAYTLWRFAYFGTLVSNTALAKVDFSWETAARGAHYVLGYWAESLAPPVQLLGLSCAWWAARWRGLAIAAMACGVPLYAAVVGGDFMTMGRLLVAGLPFLALLMGLALHVLRQSARSARPLLSAAALTLIAVGALPLLNVQLVPEDLRRTLRFRWETPVFRTEAEQWRFMRENARELTDLGLALARIERPGESVVLSAIGAVGYHTDLFVYDRAGLVTREVAMRRGRTVSRRTPGHDKLVAATFFLDREPTYLYVELVHGEAALRGKPTELSSWRGERMRRLYGPALYPTVPADPPTWLLALRRMDDPERAWQALHDEVSALAAKAQVNGQRSSSSDGSSASGAEAAPPSSR